MRLIAVSFVLLVSVISMASCGEWFSSLGHMEELLRDERELVSALDSYLKQEQARLEKIQKQVSHFSRLSDHARTDVNEFLAHPINQFRLIKRMGFEWKELEQIMSTDNSAEFTKKFQSKLSNLPDDSDLKGSAQALLRLQDTYKLDVSQFAAGNIKGVKTNESLSAEDCYYIGREAYLDKDFYHCKMWMAQALSMDEKKFTHFSKFDVLDHLAYCTSRTGNLERALKMTVEMMTLEPDNDRIQSNYVYYKKLLGDKKRGDDDSKEFVDDSPPRRQELVHYERLCRVQKPLPVSVASKLKCYYWTNNNNPRLILAPVKLEEMYPSPHIVRFYDIVDSNEITIIQKLAKPRLYRATVQNPFTGVLESADYRVSKSAWLKDYEHKVVKRVCQRIEDVTGLTMSTAEDLQIANYGIGGQYEPHYDYARESDAGKFDDEIGNRIATFLFYFTDISYGGSTVFLTPEIAAKPIKGSAVFWYNLYPSGKGDERTRHAACPVLTGIKWVGNKWIHERGQEFLRQCHLDQHRDNRIF